nr:immunoglobulin heavy chain junction region [Mus musculus]MBK4183850.1 immunoglobulin heavy chain junction region [Mus musculus]MBK4183851.1 immunoglobulin heavy chain junction region [Mus musculus]MBK4183852.1 immunoglobulin heavy chain junction region [Mus musculus]
CASLIYYDYDDGVLFDYW